MLKGRASRRAPLLSLFVFFKTNLAFPFESGGISNGQQINLKPELIQNLDLTVTAETKVGALLLFFALVALLHVTPTLDPLTRPNLNISSIT